MVEGRRFFAQARIVRLQLGSCSVSQSAPCEENAFCAVTRGPGSPDLVGGAQEYSIDVWKDELMMGRRLAPVPARKIVLPNPPRTTKRGVGLYEKPMRGMKFVHTES